MNIRTPKFIKRLGLLAMSAAVVMVSALPQEASATHWRGGNITWAPTATANEIEFTISSFWRTTFFFATPATPVDNVDTFNPFSFNFGDGSPSASGAGTVVRSHNVAGDWMAGETVLTHTYPSGGPTNFTSFLENCCRISASDDHINNPDGFYRIESMVSLDGSSGPDTNSTSPIFLLPLGGVQMFTPVAPSDPDGGAFTFALATADQAAGSGNAFVQPTGMSIDANTGEVTIDTSGAPYALGQLWSNQIYVTDSTGNTTATDFLYQTCTPGTPFCGGFVPPSVPEPGTLALMAVALLGVGGVARRKQRASN